MQTEIDEANVRWQYLNKMNFNFNEKAKFFLENFVKLILY